MSEESTQVVVPVYDRADAMRKALREAGIGVSEMAEYLDVTRGTVSSWLNGRINPSTQTLRLWALRTGVPFDWLVRHQGLEPRTRWLSVSLVATRRAVCALR
jgi:transcriptional regulator with XRE-family HTH domain